MILELKNIYKEYIQGKMSVPVLKNVDFSMEEGEYVAIMGRFRFRKNYTDEYYRMLDQPTQFKAWRMVPPYSHRVSRVRRYSGYRWLFRLFVYRTLTFFGWTSHSIPLNLYNAVFCPNPESITTLGLASSAFARHYLRNLS